MSRHPFLLRIIYFIVGMTLLPATFSLTIIVFRRVFSCQDFVTNVLPFFIGFISYLIFFLAFRKPMLAYVFGHELTHALWVLIFRGRVRSIKVTKNGGAVKATKTNPLIILAPYFFPLYTLFVICIWMLASYLYPIQRFFYIAIFFIGFTWSFHLLLNLYILRESQHDIRAVGHIFSAVTIYALNVFILGILITFISGSLTFTSFFDELKIDLVIPYQYVADWILRAYEYLRNLL